MKYNLEKKFLAKLMDWGNLEATVRFQEIDLMADIKYDSYDQFMPGIKFIGNFYLWLSQFDDLDERKLMYNFVNRYIIYINSSQISHLIDLLYNTKIIPIFREKVIEDFKRKNRSINKYNYRRLDNSPEFRSHKRRTLFIGLSDGSHIDTIRRNSYLDNDQVLTNYFPDKKKINNLATKLKESNALEYDEKKFETIVLIDDFTASGYSFIRLKEDGSFAGELPNFFDDIKDNVKFKALFSKKFEIHLFFLIATKSALTNISVLLEQYMQQHEGHKIKVDCVQTLDEDAKFTNHQEQEAKDILKIISNKRYINESALTSAYKQSYTEGDDRYHLGYKQCALTVVLNHNTPNNSMPIIWQPKREGEEPLYPLFYRKTRY